MLSKGYRSYVIRVRRRLAGTEPAPTTLDVEDLIQGGRATISGATAAEIAERLERLVDHADAPADAESKDLTS